MIKSTMYIAIAILALGFGSAYAQTFNFESKNDTPAHRTRLEILLLCILYPGLSRS